jgi:hypothetical protein
VSLKLPLDHRPSDRAITHVVGRQPIQDQYDPLNYKCTGSVVLWTLANKTHDAFVVWMLAQKYDRGKQKSRKPTGHVGSLYFLEYLAKTMNVTMKTADGRLEKAIQYGFLQQTDRGYKITSHRNMIKVAMADQERRVDDGAMSPDTFLAADREFTRHLDKWIIPHDMNATIALLSGRAMQQGSILVRGRESLGNVAGCSGRTMIRRTEAADVVEVGRYILLDPQKILVAADCSVKDAIDAFMEAEKKYRRHYHMPMNRLLHSKHVFALQRSFLAIQIANSYFSHSDIKEVPANRVCRQWKRKKRRVPSAAYASDSPIPQPPGRGSYTTWKSGKFVGSKDLGDSHVPEARLHAVMNQLQTIVDDPDCADLIMVRTGATGLRPVYAGQPRAWSERSSSDVTPSFDVPGTENVP